MEPAPRLRGFVPLPNMVLIEKVGLSFTEADLEKIMGFKDGGDVQVRLEARVEREFKPLS